MRKSIAILCVCAAAVPAMGQREFLVADREGHRLVRFHWPSGGTVDHFVAAGISKMSGPTAMVIGPDGLLYVAAYNSNDVLRYSAETGEYVSEFVTPGVVSGPNDLAFGPDGSLYVCSFNGDSVLRYNGSTGVYMNEFVKAGTGGLDGPAGFAFASDGSLIVASFNNNRILRYKPDGSFDHAIDVSATGLDGPEKIVRALDGASYYVAGNRSNSVIKIGAGETATIIVPSGSDGLDRPSALALDPDGNLLVCMYSGRDGGGGVFKYDPAGHFIGPVIGGFKGGMTGWLFGILILPEIKSCAADFNHDGKLDINDFIAFQAAWRKGCK